MKHALIAATVAIFTLTASSHLLAQAPPKGPAAQQKAGKALLAGQGAPSKAAVDAAREILALKNVGALYQGAAITAIQKVMSSLVQSNLNFQKDLQEVALKLAGDMKGAEAEIGEAMAVLYAAEFTEQEVKDLLAFYKSPLGRKTLEQEPKALELSMNYIRNWGDELAVEITGRFRSEMKKRGKDL